VAHSDALRRNGWKNLNGAFFQQDWNPPESSHRNLGSLEICWPSIYQVR
jgi:hypothetical protein